MKREEKEISPYLLESGLVMVCCPMPWKCQRRKEKCEGEKEDGQLRKEGEKEEEKRKGEDVRICPLEDMRVLLEHISQPRTRAVWGCFVDCNRYDSMVCLM